MNKLLIIIIAIFVAIAAVFFIASYTQFAQDTSDDITTNTEASTSWRNIEIKDAKTDETFKISDFAGKKILLESFAVWCPTCLKQQKEIQKLKQENIVHISIDTDPNENENSVIKHVEKHGFQWRYSVSPTEMTQSLINEFGVEIVNAPSSPVILICEDQSARLLKRGLKSSDVLLEEIERGC
jgi:thiol-disulfide isomerase/thioredoxin